MTTCNASIEVGGETVECENDHGHDAITKHMAFGMKVMWEDDALGAQPHRDPEPTYVVERWPTSWAVIGDRGEVVAMFYDVGHPDPQGAAEAEARRLLCHPHDGDESLHGAWVCDSCGVEVERDPSVVSLAELERDEALGKAMDLAAERDRYREALEQIKEHLRVIRTDAEGYASHLARRALRYGGDA